jgi:O-antigen/teichoic acid export membrane protein
MAAGAGRSRIGRRRRNLRALRGGAVPVNTAVSAARTLIRLAIGFALLPILVHRLGSASTGLFLFATTLTGYFTAVEISFGSSVTKYVAEHRAGGDSSLIAATVRGSLALMFAIGLTIAAGLVVLAVVAAHALFRGPSLHAAAEPTLLAAAAVSVVYWPSRIGIAALNGLERYDQTALIQIVSGFVVLGGLAVLASRDASVPVLTGFFGGVTALEGVASGALAWRPLGVDRSWLRGRWVRGDYVRSVARFGAAAFLIGMADTLVFSFDRTIISATVGAAAIVGYELALRPQTAVRTIAGLSGLALVSPVARLAATGRMERMRELVMTASFVSVVVTAPIAVLVIELAHPFAVAWLGAGFGRYSGYIQIFVSYWVVMCCTTAASSALYGVGRLREYALITMGQAIAALILSIVLGIAWGTVGVIWGTVIPTTLMLPAFLYVALGLLGISRTAFARQVMLPAYGVIVPWAGLVLLARIVLDPTGYAGLVAFSAAALAVFCLPAGPMLLSRWRRTRPAAAAG